MSMFQKSIINSVKQDESKVALRWASFQKFLEKVEYIKTVKEEKYQDGFLVDIFENCLGYTLDMTNPKSFNLEREKKNETDGKKADGVIYVDDKVVGVIELKGQDTKNLDKIETQAFNYHTSHSNSKYIIISNFDELRFYVDKKTAYEKFNLFTLNYEEFKKLHLLISYESIKDDIPLKLKEKTNSFEQDISKKLYKDFSNFRTLLFENIVKNNPNIDKQTLLRLTQKLCDRIIFILFAEDRDLLRTNMIKEIREEFINQKFTNYSLYDIYKFYFDAISNGNEKLDIPKYNGGLFATDELLDSLIIDDFILDENVQILSNYDFASEISVNILGHIFEQSLTDLEELQANIDNVNFDKTKSKRKKDGVFYTPEYITRYIVENTLGKMCSEKREELLIGNGILTPSNPKKLTKQEQQTKENLQEYKNWLLNLKILDPACGSGAFLNQALEYLIDEHKNLQNDLALMGDLFASYMVEEEILEHNLYGVDINEDAVEIAKLSLWLRTAKRGRALTKLADKIVCANSLLEMPFSENSFDVVIGNPPYVRVQGLKSNYENEAKLYEEKFVSATGNYDLYVLFMEQSFKMLNQKGKLSYILPHKFLISDFGNGIRGFLSKNKAVESLLHFGSEMVFEDASTYTCIINLSHNNKKLDFKSISPNDIFNPFEYDSISYENLNSDKWNLSSNDITKVLEKINLQPLRVKDVFAKIFTGIQTSGDDIYLLLETKDGLYSKALDKIVEVEKGLLKPMLKGEDISRYKNLQNRYFVIFPYILEDGKAKPMSEDFIKENYPKGYEYLKENEEFLRGREKGKMDKEGWFLYIYPKSLDLVDVKKFVVPDITLGIQITIDNFGYCVKNGGYGMIIKENFINSSMFYLSLLNSSLMWFYLKNIGTELRGGYFRFNTNYINPFPLPKLDSLEQQEPFIQKVNLMLELNKKLQELKQTLINELNLEKVPTKLQKFEELDFDDFVKEYAKAKKLKFADKLEERNFKNEWQRLFENDKKEVLEIQNQINITDKEIDQMVYKLYDLTEDEIKIVESD
ncbi:Eco57I restriction-modification methylase domain-containing protein [Aliarcobacter cryaerophilus]|uniref:site-specific DNA-methyltransferase (adenine-specific) n=1 Tax=Aliarcobacter cryaerophilus TaxID=28198 RepID=A0AA46NMX8_9BACT|nr:N-6 DNA methylase [Aliarcobacter cryaerophilus]UYF43259.1 N-6 DNA methylase [Aliarcobacter cryaerophilus]